jgi:predicted GNAT family acetyltransferase
VGAVLDHSRAAFDGLKGLLAVDETIYVVGQLPAEMPGWQLLSQSKAPQMVCEDLKPAKPVDAIKLTSADMSEILELIALAEPGPFLSRTIEMGQYLGFRQDGRLVAMAGERLHLTGFCEISAVCTHPEIRGRGYASALTSMAATAIIARGEVPFLHVDPNNEVAIRIYQKLGFRLREEIQLNMLQKVG